VTKLENTSITLMIDAAVASNFCVFRMRRCGAWGGRFSASPATSGITETPVSKPLRPNASLGKTKAPTTASEAQSPRNAKLACQWSNRCGCCRISQNARMRTTRFNAR